jgi:hypothetical protein
MRKKVVVGEDQLRFSECDPEFTGSSIGKWAAEFEYKKVLEREREKRASAESEKTVDEDQILFVEHSDQLIFSEAATIELNKVYDFKLGEPDIENDSRATIDLLGRIIDIDSNAMAQEGFALAVRQMFKESPVSKCGLDGRLFLDLPQLNDREELFNLIRGLNDNPRYCLRPKYDLDSDILMGATVCLMVGNNDGSADHMKKEKFGDGMLSHSVQAKTADNATKLYNSQINKTETKLGVANLRQCMLSTATNLAENQDYLSGVTGIYRTSDEDISPCVSYEINPFFSNKIVQAINCDLITASMKMVVQPISHE